MATSGFGSLPPAGRRPASSRRSSPHRRAISTASAHAWARRRLSSAASSWRTGRQRRDRLGGVQRVADGTGQPHLAQSAPSWSGRSRVERDRGLGGGDHVGRVHEGGAGIESKHGLPTDARCRRAWPAREGRTSPGSRRAPLRQDEAERLVPVPTVQPAARPHARMVSIRCVEVRASWSRSTTRRLSVHSGAGFGSGSGVRAHFLPVSMSILISSPGGETPRHPAPPARPRSGRSGARTPQSPHSPQCFR